MESQIEQIISETYSRYQRYGHHQSGFYDMTLSIVSWFALSSQEKDGLVQGLDAPEQLLPFSDIADRFEEQKIAAVLKHWERHKGSYWEELLRLDASLIELIPDTYWQFMLAIWNRLFTKPNTDVNQLVLKIFDQLEQAITMEQKDEHMHITPKAVTSIMAHYLGGDSEGVLYDPFARTGNLLSEALKQLPSVRSVIGFSPINLCWKLANLRLLFTSETLKPAIQKEQYYEPVTETFDFIICNPPFGHQMIDDQQLKHISNDWSDLARKCSRLEIYYLCHILSHLADKGRASVLLPGIFLSGSIVIKELIKRLLEQNILDAVIALPAGLFAHTAIPIVMVSISKNRKIDDRVLLADASAEIGRNGRQNILKTEKIESWFECLKSQSSTVDNPLIVMVTAKDIAQRDYNLYVAAYKKTETLIKNRAPSIKLKSEYEELEDKIAMARTELITYLSKNSD
jgi:hypothetical protein